MMKPLILSVRSSHLDDLPAWIVMETLKWLKIHSPSTPITLCFENDTKLNVAELIADYHQKLEAGISQHFNTPYRNEELEHDKSIFWLLKTTQRLNVHFKTTDPCEEKVTTELTNAAAEKGGIVFDFGHIQYTSGIQKNLAAMEQFESTFFCAYSHKGQYHHSANFRMMRFSGVPKKLFPKGLNFLTTNLSEEHHSEWKHSRLEKLEKKRALEKLTAYLSNYLEENTPLQTKLLSTLNTLLQRVDLQPKRLLKSSNSPW